MIAYAIVLLTDVEKVQGAGLINVQCGIGVLSVDGDAIRSFIRCANKAYKCYPGADCLEIGLEHVHPPELRCIFAHLYERLKGVII